MKKKFNFWLQIVTICLCICAIAVGVYSATTAKITAGGKIAFTAHNCKVQVGGYIYGHAAGNKADGLPVAQESKETFNSITFEGGVNTAVEGTLNIGERYFTDMASTDGKPANIIIGITITNLTIYDISVTTNLSNVTLPDEQVSITCNITKAQLSKSQSVTFEYTLELNPDSAGNTGATYSGFDLSNLIIPITSQKYEFELINYDSANSYYYIEMGTNPFKNNEPLRWIPFAESTNGSSFSAFSKTSEPQSGNTYYFISELALRPEYSTSSYGGIPFQGDYTYVSDENSYIKGTQYRPQDYAVSNVRAFLRGEMAYSTCTYSNNVATPGAKNISLESLGYNILSSVVYTKHITARALSDLYITTTLMTTKYNCGTEADKLWLLNADEALMMGARVGDYDGTCSTVDGGTTTAKWWSREPYYPTHKIGVVGAYSEFSSGHLAHDSNSVRPAFQVTIP